MRIGFDYRLGGRLYAGLGRYSQALLHALVANTEHQFVVFYRPSHIHPKDLERLRELKQVELVEADFRHYSIAEQIFFPKVIRSAQVDLMHFPNFNVPVFCPAPFVVTIHDMVHHKLRSHKLTSGLWYQAYKFVMTKAVQNSKLIITPSEASKKDILRYYPNLESKIIHVILEGAETHPVTTEQLQKVRQSFLLTRPYFLFVGTLERKRDLPTLAQGFNKFVEHSGLDMDLVVAGKVDQHYPKEREVFLGLPHSNRVVLTGQVTEEELQALYQGAFAYVQPSPNEGFGLPGVEAMQYNLPLVVANTEVFNELYDQAALYFTPGNAHNLAEQLELLATDSKFYSQKQTQSHEQGHKFDWKIAAEQTLACYSVALDQIRSDS